jgi:hypothetical protein
MAAIQTVKADREATDKKVITRLVCVGTCCWIAWY